MKRILNSYHMLSAIIFLGCCSTRSFAQDSTVKKNSIKLPANIQYNKAGKVKRMLLGEHYRKEWATPVDIVILDMNIAAGGLTPVKLGGGLQTKSLRLKGADGKEYVLRSVNKDPSKALPQELSGTIAADILQDQISSSNPYVPLVVASLAQAAGIFHAKPQLVYVPQSKRLGEFEKEFTGTICLLEERPSGNQENNPAFGFSKNVVNSEKLFEKLLTDQDHSMDERAFLKARLFDMWIGDWDRHQDQWLWASFKTGNKTIYKPISRDRDQAFPKLDGLIPHMGSRRWALRRMQNFDYTIRDINGLNMSGNFLDRNFTNSLTLQDWLEVSNELQQALTNQVIEDAFREMPAPIFQLSGEGMIAKLKKRRDDLERYAHDYYKFLTKETSIIGTYRKEIFELNRINDDSTVLIVYSNKDAGKEVRYKRTFLRSETNEIRLYGFGGKDVFDVSGDVNKGIVVRMIGGEGEDSFNDSSRVKGMAHKTKIYDDSKNIYNTGKESRKYISTDTLKNEYNRQSLRYDWLAPRLKPGYNPDDGVYVGGGLIFKKQRFGKAPFGYMQSVFANYAFKTGAYNFWYEGIFREAVHKWDLHLDARLNAPNFVRNYYGLGNESEMLVSDKSYYRVRSDELVLSTGFYRQFSNTQSVGGGIEYQTIKIEKSSNRFVSDPVSKLDSTSFGRKYYGGAFLDYQFTTLDNIQYPRKGIKMNAGFRLTHDLKDDAYLPRFSYESAMFASIGRLTGALRIGFATNLNDDYEFFQANTLGGATNLRGFRRDRFAGKTSFFNDTEIRFKLGGYRGYIFRGEYGIFSFIDNGRVWIPGEKSNTWHYGYGGGIWFLAYNRLPFTVSYGTSKEDNIINIKAGFLF